MSIKAAQTLLATTADGNIGPKTLAAARAALAAASVTTLGWSDQRVVYGAAQALLTASGDEPGHIDGYWGHNSQNAYESWASRRAGNPIVLERSEPSGPADPATTPAGASRFPRQADMQAFYGPAGGPRCTAGTVRFPIPHFLAWNLSDQVNTFRCHELIAPAFQVVFDEAVKHYGEAEYRRLRLDLFGGCFNNRNMRGGSAKSTHAYGAAVDLDPERNQLKWGKDRASFARQEYVPFWNIVEGAGLVSLGRLKNFDWMHFQGARL